ncbi:WXG100 family type VII secretion target [Amycolatopsis sp. NPDC023774]|uniref:WXG100 family type VII secretion target n=1 Tax=Amycolatopsis sp. NPDC023774 TaxID=3155015 RepID=UPI003409B6B5
MALGNFQINFTAMTDTVGSAKQQAQQITSLLEEMHSKIQAQREHWTGAAADEFQSTYEWCHQQAQVLPQALDAAAQTLSHINEGTSATESGNAQRFAQR